MNQHLLDAWLKTPMAGEGRCHLIFVGQDSQNNPYCERVAPIHQCVARQESHSDHRLCIA